MKQWFISTVVILVVCVGSSAAQAQYDQRQGSLRSTADDQGFEESVDLERFRQGNIEWDTQELIASGIMALHRDHQKILKELAEINASLKKLEGQR